MKRSSSGIIMVVEDDEPKLRSIVNFLRERIPAATTVATANSLTSAIRCLSSTPVGLAIVDMSIPTYDVNTDRSGGGQPQGFGGADILRFIESETKETRSVVITQYQEFPADEFGSFRDIHGLDLELRSELSDRFLGVIHYSGQQGDWRDQLSRILLDQGLAEDHEILNR